MANNSEMYYEEVTPANEIKGFTKSFQKRTKNKREEDKDVVELLGYIKSGNVVIGTKTTEKSFKNGSAKRIYVASNCDEFSLKKIEHYGKILKVDIVKLALDNNDLAQKLGKPFVVSMVCVRNV
ncbi:MAG: ribosomal L7Ae/L30e/S12e/Gadd45 family protein [Nanoarchaeota archaeon]|nr:ribosomal L7Ae/L30e/S12e/Gadd45 family protein [Nanoarchaeota archaeon]